MTARLSSRLAGGPPIGPHEYPALRAFCRGYLHEDLAVEHGSASGAARAFLADAAPPERQAVRHEWVRLRRAAASPRALGRALDVLGAAWRPRTRADIADLDAVLLPPRP